MPAIGIGYFAAAHIFTAAQQAIRRGGVFQALCQGECAVDRLSKCLPALATGKVGLGASLGVSCRKAGNFTLCQRQFAATEAGAFARGVDVGDAGLLPAIHRYCLVSYCAAKVQRGFNIGYQAVTDSQPLAGDCPLYAAGIAQRNGFKLRLAVGANHLATAQIASRGEGSQLAKFFRPAPQAAAKTQ